MAKLTAEEWSKTMECFCGNYHEAWAVAGQSDSEIKSTHFLHHAGEDPETRKYEFAG